MTQEILQKCTVEGNIIKLPDFQIYRKVYLEVKNALELIGGKWKGGKVQGFVFQEDPTSLLNKISNRVNLDLKKDYQILSTRSELADRLVEISKINDNDLVLEPSAGQGEIIKAIHKLLPNTHVEWCEINNVNQEFCRNIPNTRFITSDFLLFDKVVLYDRILYDRIIANPPSSKNQDIEHIYNMYSCLKKGGRMVSVTSEHWQNQSGKKEINFFKWLISKKSEMYNIKVGTYKKGGTMKSVTVIAIDKK